MKERCLRILVVVVVSVLMALWLTGCRLLPDEVREKTWPLEMAFGDGYVEPWGDHECYDGCVE